MTMIKLLTSATLPLLATAVATVAGIDAPLALTVLLGFMAIAAAVAVTVGAVREAAVSDAPEAGYPEGRSAGGITLTGAFC
jgi:uncharacterized membrane protein HdeD (DUF308 family)